MCEDTGGNQEVTPHVGLKQVWIWKHIPVLGSLSLPPARDSVQPLINTSESWIYGF